MKLISCSEYFGMLSMHVSSMLGCYLIEHKLITDIFQDTEDTHRRDMAWRNTIVRL